MKRSLSSLITDTNVRDYEVKEININTKRPRKMDNNIIQKIKNKILKENKSILKGEL